MLGIHPEAADTEGDVQAVLNAAVFCHAAAGGIEIRVLHAMPTVSIHNGQGSVRPLPHGYRSAFSIQQGYFHLPTGHPALNPNECVASVRSCRYPHAAGAQIIQIEMRLGNNHQPHIPIDAAVKGEVRLLGIDSVIFRVVHLYGQLVVLLQQSSNLAPESGITAVMDSNQGSIEAHPGRGVDALKFQVNAFILT